MMTNNKYFGGNYSNIISLIMLHMIAFLVLCNFGFFMTETSAAQKFYPNGRYGRRSVLPPLMALDNTDDAITFIGNIAPNTKFPKTHPLNDQTMTLLCYTGFGNYLRCNIRETLSDALDRSNNESQQ
ncbi:uncharacterized protein LOC128952503 [Oppia nitens]|uniref:uncharacterized protein LOC128952503 n=1 Tax=Oppia nitens TaxID=1686743 RepID=UPI0023DC0C9B|nr:uncharacterized protein LOC128952503 [Oppia nitens]